MCQSDEEEAEDVLEIKDKVEIKSESPEVKKKTIREDDLGASAVYAQVQKDTSKDLVVTNDEQPMRANAQVTHSSNNDLLDDLFSSPESRPVASIPPFQSTGGDNAFGNFESAPGQSDGGFADFASFSEAKPSSPKDDFADFQSSAPVTPPSKQNGELFSDFSSASSKSNQELLAQNIMNDSPVVMQPIPIQTMGMVS